MILHERMTNLEHALDMRVGSVVVDKAPLYKYCAGSIWLCINDVMQSSYPAFLERWGAFDDFRDDAVWKMNEHCDRMVGLACMDWIKDNLDATPQECSRAFINIRRKYMVE